MGTILLYYKYCIITDPTAIMHEQRTLCQKLGLKGRILIAREGINGTVGGSAEAAQEYRTYMRNHELFSTIDFKEAPGSADHFPRLQIKVKKEIVRLGIDPALRPIEKTGAHLQPAQVHELISKKPDNLIILDARNNYESAIGAFEGAIKPSIDNFRDLPGYIDQNLELFKDKQVLMYCTGGIRCETASAYLNTKNIAQAVYQIEGGICRYVEEYPEGYFKGKNYVFDGRIAVPVTNDILTECLMCLTSCDDYTNCINAACNRQVILCPPCLEKFNNTCSAQCLELVRTHQVVIRTVPKKTTSHLQSCSL